MSEPCAALDRFCSLDPDLARRLTAACRQAPTPHSPAEIQTVVDTLLECFESEIHFGQAAADGYEALLAYGTPAALAAYGAAVRRDGRHGAGLGRATATFLPPVLLTGEARLLRAYRRTVAVLLGKGAYLLTAPLEGMRWLLNKADRSAAAAYLDLLQTVFNRRLSYNRCQYLGNLLPRQLMRMPETRRRSQLRQLARIAAADLRLLEPFLEGLDRGLNLLTDQALTCFTDQALDCASRQFEQAVRFTALRSDRGRESCRALQTAVPLSRVLAGLNRYLQARTGRPPGLKPLTALPGITDEALLDGPRTACDGACIYLPEEIDHYPRRETNTQLFRLLTKFEAGLIEYGTFRFDLERGRDLGLASAESRDRIPDPACGGLGQFMDGFAHRRLARDLFTIFEHARLRVRLQADYPGLVRQGLPVFQAEFTDRQAERSAASLLDAAYARLALDLPAERIVCETPADQALAAHMHAAFIEAALSE